MHHRHLALAAIATALTACQPSPEPEPRATAAPSWHLVAELRDGSTDTMAMRDIGACMDAARDMRSTMHARYAFIYCERY